MVAVGFEAEFGSIDSVAAVTLSEFVLVVAISVVVVSEENGTDLDWQHTEAVVIFWIAE